MNLKLRLWFAKKKMGARTIEQITGRRDPFAVMPVTPRMSKLRVAGGHSNGSH
jgi:hypothetical protein